MRAQALLVAVCQNMKKMARLLEQALRSLFALFMHLWTAPQALHWRCTQFGKKPTVAPTAQLALA
ncbi:hypothetical protein GCM10027343_06280 [Noviherbaspirillum agri]